MLENINTQLVAALGPLGPLLAVGGLGLLLVLIALPAFLSRKPDPLDKLRETARPRPVADGAQPLRHNDGGDKLKRFATVLEPQNAEQLTAARLKMLRAGYRSKNAVRMFHAAQLLLGLGAIVAGVVYTLITSDPNAPRSMHGLLMTTILPGAIGYYLPIYWVQRRLQERQQQMVEGFPDALDMMLVCVEAGQSLDQSINRVAKEIRLGYPALGEEFEMVAHQVKAGKERVQVLRDFAERTGVPDIASFATTLVQSTTFGTSIAEALRVYAGEMRDKRVMRAEEKANTLPTKLTLGTMMFTVPPLLIILIGPSVVGIIDMMGGK